MGYQIGDRVEVRYDAPNGWDWRIATVHTPHPNGCVTVVFDKPAPTPHPMWMASPENVRSPTGRVGATDEILRVLTLARELGTIDLSMQNAHFDLTLDVDAAIVQHGETLQKLLEACTALARAERPDMIIEPLEEP